jgi:hypothetical protein
MRTAKLKDHPTDQLLRTNQHPQRRTFEALAARVAAAGELFRGFFEPEALVAAMRAMGFHGVRDMGPDELNAHLILNRADGPRVGSAGHILMAVG